MTYPAQPQYQPQMPQYPQQAPPAPPMPYPPQMPYGYPQQAPPAPPLAQGTLSSFYGQPSVAGGPSWSWQNKPIGHSYSGIVARTITSSDIQQVTTPQGQPQTFRDGRPKFQMAVPMQVQPSPDFPQGEATWYVQARGRDELNRAMAEAGCSQEVINGGPEKGAGLVVTLVERRAGKPGFNPSNIVQVRYQRPASATNSAPVPPAQPSAPMHQGPAQPQQPAPYVGPVPPAQPASQIPTQPAPTAMTPPPGLTEEQIHILAQLTGQAPQ